MQLAIEQIVFIIYTFSSISIFDPPRLPRHKTLQEMQTTVVAFEITVRPESIYTYRNGLIKCCSLYMKTGYLAQVHCTPEPQQPLI